MNSKLPKQVDPGVIQSFAEAVPLGEYRMYSASGQLPASVSWAGLTCQAVVIAASAYSRENLPESLSKITPSGHVYLCRAFRADPDASPHWNVDDSLYFTDRRGSAWMIHSKSSPDHFKHIVSGSGLGDLIRDYNLPSASTGRLDEYRLYGARLDFEEPFES